MTQTESCPHSTHPGEFSDRNRVLRENMTVSYSVLTKHSKHPAQCQDGWAPCTRSYSVLTVTPKQKQSNFATKETGLERASDWCKATRPREAEWDLNSVFWCQCPFSALKPCREKVSWLLSRKAHRSTPQPPFIFLHPHSGPCYESSPSWHISAWASLLKIIRLPSLPEGKEQQIKKEIRKAVRVPGLLPWESHVHFCPSF